MPAGVPALKLGLRVFSGGRVGPRAQQHEADAPSAVRVIAVKVLAPVH